MITIIGGSGFIGTRLCKRLEKKNIKFKIIDKVMSKAFVDKCQLADVRDIESIDKLLTSDDIIINLAAEHHDNVTPKTLYDEVNVQGAKNICEIAEKNNINTIIFTSSVAVYGFAPPGTKEDGKINYFNDYGRTKYEAELVYRAWYQKDPLNRKLIIIRPTVVFGEENRGNVYNLFNQIVSGTFVMIGNGKNRKSMAYVENLTAFLEYSLSFKNGLHVYNYVDKPDFDMNRLVALVRKVARKKDKLSWLRLPFFIGYSIGIFFDIISAIIGKKFVISSIRVKKFCSDSMFDTSLDKTGFIPSVSLEEAVVKTIKYEFLKDK